MGSQGRGLQDELQGLRDEVSELASRLSSLGSETSDAMAEEIKTRIQRIGDDIDGAISQAQSKGREALSQAQAKGREVVRQTGLDEVGDTVESSIREHPFATLAIAIGVGALVGSQLRR